jgi:hypothetical protein
MFRKKWSQPVPKTLVPWLKKASRRRLVGMPVPTLSTGYVKVVLGNHNSLRIPSCTVTLARTTQTSIYGTRRLEHKDIVKEDARKNPKSNTSDPDLEALQKPSQGMIQLFSER